jgi:hypothetical protein
MANKFLSGINVTGTATLNTVVNAGTNTDKFLVLDASGNVDFRTALELYNDLGIGSLPAGFTSTVKHAVKAGVALTKGQAVYVTGADGTNMIVGKASNASEATSSKTMGLIESNLSQNGQGVVITEGLLAGLDTTGATNAGDPVWLGVDGNLIYGLTNKPYAPAHLVFIGIVTRINANNGEIFVKVQNGFELREIHDVDLITTTPINGHILGYNGTLWVNKTIAGWLGYTPVTNARTLTINGTSYDLSADRSWTINSMVYPSAGIALSTGTAWGTSITDNSSNWNTAYGWGNHASAGYAASSHTHSIANVTGLQTALDGKQASGSYAASVHTHAISDVTGLQTALAGKQAQLNGTGFVKVSGTTVSYDNSTYLTTASATSTYLPLAGGSLTGALNGTIASFTLNQPSSSAVTITNTNTSSYLSRASFKANQGTIQGILEAGNSTVYIGSNSNHSVTIGSNGAGAMVFTSAAADMLVPFQSAVSITNSTASTSKTTGALKVTGGVGVSGALNVGGDVVAYASSDRRLKDNIQNIKNPIQKVQKLNGVTWDWNSNADELQQSLPNVGVIAQEVEEVLPQLVHDRENGFKAVDYARLTGLLIEAVKEQQTQIQELKEFLNQFIK